jgi:bacterioferritin (cytochrome b1)
VPYIPVESLSMQERVRLMERVLDLAGLPQLQTVAAPAPAEGIAQRVN